MIVPSDLIHLPYTSDLTEGGIAYAVRSLPYTYDRMGGSSFDRLRRIVAGVAVELAFRRYLTRQDIPFDVKGATPFTDPDRYDVSLGGHRCDLKSFLITHREQISDMRRDAGILLKAPALVPSDQHAAEGHRDDDLYLFAFLTGILAASQADLKKALAADQPCHLLHVMPDAWAKPQTWSPLGRLALKSESDAPLRVELSGQDERRGFLTRTLELPPHTRVEAGDPFFALSSVRLEGVPQARLGIHSPIRNETHLIAPREWGNIWVYGMDIWLAGYVTREEFRRRAHNIPSGSRVFQYDRTRTKNLAVPVRELKPLGELLEQVKAWEAGRP
ncbi:MAG TPA: hypothetical protein VGJ22_06210 [Anaerolineales bacterium]|jgi:hypothetical protein